MDLAIICGSGADELSCLASGRPKRVSTRYGEVDLIEGQISGTDALILPRHGLGHAVSPSLINYRAQMAALRDSGVRTAIGICAVGSLKAELRCGRFAVLADFIDLTRRRVDTFYGEPGDPVVHTDFTEPYCPRVSNALTQACADAGVEYESAAVYVGVEGPRYESPAEVRLYASWGADVIGMTNLPEAVLAREAGICYGALAIVTNLAAGLSPTPLTHDEVRGVVHASAEKLSEVLERAVSLICHDQGCRCGARSSPQEK